MSQRARVKLMMVPTIVVQVGGIEDDFGFVAEEEYHFTKSGFRGHINRIHESGPCDSSDMDHVGFDSVEKALRGAFKEGDDSMSAVGRVRLLHQFKVMSSKDVIIEDDDG